MKKDKIIFPAVTQNLMPHMSPYIRISPFIAREWARILKASSPRTSPADNPRFWLDNAVDMKYYDSGRRALWACLKHLHLKPADNVLILTTTNGPYISGCVTQTIEKVCRWTRTLTPKTKLVLVIHEFGFPCPAEKIIPCTKLGIPVLEDCAYAFGSRVEGAGIGRHGDFGLYSFTKYFPIPLGGLLVAKEKINKSASALKIPSPAEGLLRRTINHSLPYLKDWNKTRRAFWREYAAALQKHGFFPYFPLREKIVPGVYLTKVPARFDGEIVKKKLNTRGVESTQYYHQGGFYFPCHQFLTDYERAYILRQFLYR